jgi:DUF971 family protein
MAQDHMAKPRNVQVLPEAIAIQWDDGHFSTYPHRFLRLQCRCAACVGEWPRQGALDPATVPEDVYALEYQPVGRYAIQFLWSDAHYTGLYPHDFLRAMCQCPECAAGGG